MTCLLLLVALCCNSICSAQVQCSGTLSGTINNNVECDGDCVLDGATVNGNVDCSTGTLLARGSSTINGGVTISGSVTSVDLEAVIVNGAVTVTNASSLTTFTTTSAATLGPVVVTDTSCDVVLSGQIDGLTLTNSGYLFLDGLSSANGGVSVTGGTGFVDICGSTIGSLSVSEHTGDIVIDATLQDCGVSTVRVSLSITSHYGNVRLSNFISMTNLLVNSVTGNVELRESNLGWEDAVFVLVDGSVTIASNFDLNLVVKECGDAVSISENVITNSNIRQNLGGVSMVDNTIHSLSCSDNVPRPTGSGNNITFPAGQCSSGFP